MSYSDPDPMQDPDTIDPDESRGIREARAAAERNAAEAARAKDLERELALVKALPGVDLDSPLGKMFAGAYDGKLDAEAIKAAAAEVGLVAADPEPEPEPQVDPLDIEAQRQREALNRGPSTPPASDDEIALAVHPKDRAMTKFQEAMKKGLPREKAAGQYFDEMVSAAVGGDERATWDGWTEDQLAGL